MLHQAALENDLKTCPEKGKGKLLYIEVLRVLAIIAVIYVHTALAWSSAENLNCSPWVSWLTLGLSPLFSINVPLFFMISGALMLSRSEAFDKKYFRRIYRMVVVLLAYWLIQYAACISLGDATFGIRTYVRTLFTGQGFWGCLRGQAGSFMHTCWCWSLCLSSACWQTGCGM